MAKKKKKSGGTKAKAKRSNGRHASKRKNPRRRRNPRGMTFGTAIGYAVAAMAVMLGTGVIVTLATAKFSPGHPMSLYGIPAVTAIGGAWLATKAPLIGIGVAVGAASPFVLPLGSRLLGAGSGTQALNGLAGHATRALGAVSLGAVELGDEEEMYEYD